MTLRIDSRFEVGQKYYAEFGFYTADPMEVEVLSRTKKYVTFLVPRMNNYQVRAYVYENPQAGCGNLVGSEYCLIMWHHDCEVGTDYRGFQVTAHDKVLF